MILYVVRHGETQWNKVKRMQGQTDIPLAEEGIRLARISGERMRELPIDLVISSPLQRAVETAKLMTQGRDIPFLTDERIQEISFGDYEGELVLESKNIPENFRQIFYEHPLDLPAPPNGESFADVIARTGEFFREITANPEYADKHILISSHGAASRCFLTNFFEDKTDIWRGTVPPNCGVSIVEYTEGVCRVHKLDHLYYKDEQ